MKLRSGKSIWKNSAPMNKTDVMSQEVPIEVSVNSSDTVTNVNLPLLSTFRTVLNQISSLKEQFDFKIDESISKLTKQLEELKSEMNNAFVNFQKELGMELDSKWKDIHNNIEGKINDKLNNGEICRNDNKRTDNNALSQLHDINSIPCGKISCVNSATSSFERESCGESCNSVIPKKSLVDVTPMKALSLPCIFESPDCSQSVTSPSCVSSVSKSLIVPVLSNSPLQSFPILTSNPIVVSSVQQSVKPLRTLRPKPSINDELNVSDFDGCSEDQPHPNQLFSMRGERVPLPQRVRTRGGLRRIESKSSSSALEMDDDESAQEVIEKRESNRGGRHGRKSRQNLLSRRQSERLKKSDSSKKCDELEKTIGDTPLEEFLWGNNSNDDDTLDSNSNKEMVEVIETIKETCDKVMTDSEVCGGENVEIASTSKTLIEEKVQNIEINSHDQENNGGSDLVDQSKCSQEKDDNTDTSVERKNLLEKTPRNFPSKKGLSLSSPRKGSHIRALDFATPLQAPPLRRAITSPKAASLGKLTQIKSLRRANLFKSPIKKSKSSWDADLRAFVESDIPNTSNNIRKRSQPKRLGRNKKFVSPKKKISRGGRCRKSCKTPLKAKKDSPKIINNDCPSETTEELVKQIEKDVLEVISDGIRNSDVNSSSNNNFHLESDKIQQSVSTSSHNNNNFLIPATTPLKLIDKTPAKLDLPGIIPSDLMTPVTKILKEQSSLLENVNFLTPGFLPTPDSINCIMDARKAGTPSPHSMKPNNPESDSDQSNSPIKVCPVRIEDVLAAEKEVAKPIQKISCKSPKLMTTPELSVDKNSKKYKVTPFSKSDKNQFKSERERIIDECLKQAERDLYGDTSPKNSKKLKLPEKKRRPKLSYKNDKDSFKNVSDSRFKKTPLKTVEKKCAKKISRLNVPSFKEMMAQLEKTNKVASSSSDSDEELKNKKIDHENGPESASSDSFPRLQVSEDESTCSISTDNRLKIRKRIATMEGKFSESHSMKNAEFKTIPRTSVESSKQISYVSEQIKDFSYASSVESPLNDFTLQYFDEGKGDCRTVKASQAIHLFDFPLIYKPKSEINVKTPKKYFIGTEVKNMKDLQANSKVKELLSNIQASRKIEPPASENLGKKAIHSREGRYGRSKTNLSSHRSKYSRDRSMTPVDRFYRRRSRDRYLDTPHKKYKRERAEEYRKNLNRKSPSPRDRSRHIHRIKENNPLEHMGSTRGKHSHSMKSSMESKSFDKIIIDKQKEDLKISKSSLVKEPKGSEEGNLNISSREVKSKGEIIESRIPFKSKSNQGLLDIKPVAESTPYSIKPSNAVERKYPNETKPLFPETIESPERINFSPVSERLELSDPRLSRPAHRLSRISEEGELSGSNSSQLNISPSDPRLKKSYMMKKTCDNLSPQSPPRDPRLYSRSHGHNSIMNTSRKRKLDEEKEEGEISDDSSAHHRCIVPSSLQYHSKLSASKDSYNR